MIYFISDFGFFHCDTKGKLLERNLEKLKNDVEQQQKDDTILLLGGDNFYPDGIDHANDIKLTRFGELFEFLPPNKIHAVLGNHDYAGNIDLQFKNNFFNCQPDYYIVSHGNLDIYMIDTTVIDYISYTDHFNVYTKLYPEEHKAFMVENDKIRDKFDWNWDWDWITKHLITLFNHRHKILKAIDAAVFNPIANGKKCMFVGHYPMQSYGTYKYNNANNCVLKHLGPLLLKHSIEYYVSGHDHGNQHLYYNEQELFDLIKNQSMTLYDDNVFINETLDCYKSINSDPTIHFNMLICGSFVDTYPVASNTKDTLYNQNIIISNSDKNMYLKIDVNNNIIVFDFIDTHTTKSFYSFQTNL